MCVCVCVCVDQCVVFINGLNSLRLFVDLKKKVLLQIMLWVNCINSIMLYTYIEYCV